MAALIKFFIIFVALKLAKAEDFTVLYDWKILDYAFPTDADRLEQICDKRFICENNVITGLDRWRSKIFVAIPRNKLGVPATLAWLPYDASMSKVSGAKLTPYPTWEMNQLGNCSVLQNVNSVAVDTMNRLWVIDTGRTNVLGDTPVNTCPPKLVIFDLNSGKILKQHIFTEGCISTTKTVLSRIVVSVNQSDAWAYVSDSGDAKLIVYNLAKDKSWFVRHDSMKIDTSAVVIRINGKDYRIPGAINGVALSPKSQSFSHLFYAPLSSLHMYRLDAEALQCKLTDTIPGLTLAASDVKDLGCMLSQTDGMMNDAKGMLYHGQLSLNAVYKWNSTLDTINATSQVLVIRDETALQWPADIAIDEHKNGFVLSNRFHLYYTGTVDVHQVNIRIVRFRVGSRNYLNTS